MLAHCCEFIVSYLLRVVDRVHLQRLDDVRNQILVRGLRIALLLNERGQVGQGAENVVDDGRHHVSVRVRCVDRCQEHVAYRFRVRHKLVGRRVRDDVQGEGAHLDKTYMDGWMDGEETRRKSSIKRSSIFRTIEHGMRNEPR